MIGSTIHRPLNATHAVAMTRLLQLSVSIVSLGWLTWCCTRFVWYFRADPVWSTFSVLSTNLVLGLGVLTAGGLVLGLVACYAPARLERATALAITTLGIVLLAASRSWVFAAEAVTVLSLVAILAAAGQRLIARATGEKVALWTGLLLAVALVHYGLFALALVGGIGRLGVGLVVATVVLAGLLAGRPPVMERPAMPFSPFGFADAMLAFALTIAAAAAFMAASLPQSAADPVVHYLPFMRALVESGSFPNDRLHWTWLIVLPIQLLGAGLFAFLGEMGAGWLSWLGYLLAALIAGVGTIRLSGSRTAGLATAFVVTALAPVWSLGTSPYVDLVAAALAVGAVLVLGDALAGRYRLLPVAGLLIGFAASFKLHMPLFLAAAVVGLVLARPRAALSLIRQRRLMIVAALLFLVAVAPWYFRVYLITGNPLFPLFSTLFPSWCDYVPYFSEELWTHLTLGYLLTLPWELTFHTGNFGGDLDGSFGPVLLAVLFLLPFALTKRESALAFVVPAIAFVALSTLIMKVGAFRYWLPSFLLLASAFGAAGASWSRFVSLGHRIRNVCTVVGTAGLLAFLLGYGVRINYFVPDGIGSAVYSGAVSREDFVRQRTAGVSDFVNSNIMPGETVLSSAFYYLNTLKPTSLFFTSLGEHFYTDEAFERLLSDYNVRFWIINPLAPESGREAEHRRLRAAFAKDDAIVYGNGSYIVYDLKRGGLPPVSLASHRLGDRAGTTSGPDQWFASTPVEDGRAVATVERQIFQELTLPAGGRLLRGAIRLEAVPAATVLVDLVWFGADGKEINRSTLSATAGTEAFDVPVTASVPGGATRLILIVRPWRGQDGAVTVHSARLDIF